MLPGYNHNIRYKDKVFHVQTEDNGLDDPDIVTQVFLGGQIVAIERSSYGELLVEALEERDRDQKIKLSMQEQHKRLLKNLVLGMYDARIDGYAKAAAAAIPVPAESSEPDFSIDVDVDLDGIDLVETPLSAGPSPDQPSRNLHGTLPDPPDAGSAPDAQLNDTARPAPASASAPEGVHDTARPAPASAHDTARPASARGSGTHAAVPRAPNDTARPSSARGSGTHSAVPRAPAAQDAGSAPDALLNDNARPAPARGTGSAPDTAGVHDTARPAPARGTGSAPDTAGVHDTARPAPARGTGSAPDTAGVHDTARPAPARGTGPHAAPRATAAQDGPRGTGPNAAPPPATAAQDAQLSDAAPARGTGPHAAPPRATAAQDAQLSDAAPARGTGPHAAPPRATAAQDPRGTGPHAARAPGSAPDTPRGTGPHAARAPGSAPDTPRGTGPHAAPGASPRGTSPGTLRAPPSPEAGAAGLRAPNIPGAPGSTPDSSVPRKTDPGALAAFPAAPSTPDLAAFGPLTPSRSSEALRAKQRSPSVPSTSDLFTTPPAATRKAPSTSDLLPPKSGPVQPPSITTPSGLTLGTVGAQDIEYAGGVEDDDGELITAESLLSPDAVLELEDVLGNETIFMPATRAKQIVRERTPSTTGSEARTQEDRIYTDDELREVIDKELEEQMPWSPDPKGRRRRASSARNAPIAPPPVVKIPTDQAETKIGRRPNSQPRADGTPHPTDTLIDYGLPAGLRKEIDREISRRTAERATKRGPSEPGRTMLPPESNTPRPGHDPRVARFRAPPLTGGGDRAAPRWESSPSPFAEEPDRNRKPARSGRGPTTEVDLHLDRARTSRISDTVTDGERPSRELISAETPSPIPLVPPAPSTTPYPHMPPPISGSQPGARTGSQRDTQVNRGRFPTGETAPGAPAKPGEEARPSILVVERSLDEVILSYLAEDLSGEE